MPQRALSDAQAQAQERAQDTYNRLLPLLFCLRFPFYACAGNGKRVLTRVKLVNTLVRSTLGGVEGGWEAPARCNGKRVLTRVKLETLWCVAPMGGGRGGMGSAGAGSDTPCWA